MVKNNVGTEIVKYIVVAICILFMVFVIYKLYRDSVAASSETVYWPPEINRCPDYWVYEDDGLCHGNGSTMEPLSADVTDADLINTCNNIKAQGIAWEGVDNLC